MKTNLKKASLLLTGLMVGGKLLAQTPDSTSTKNYVQPFSDGGLRTWSIGINGGALSPFTIFGTNNRQDFKTPQYEIGYGAYIKKQISSSFGIQADFLAGKVKGKDAQANAGGYNSFQTKMQWSAALSGNLTLANINWRHKKGGIQPYVTFGGGVLNYKPVLTTTAGASTPIFANDESAREFFIPLGAGLKFNIANGVNLDLGYQVNFVATDNFDGLNVGSGNDRFSYAHIGLEFALGKSSKPQLATYNPVNSMRTEYLWENEKTKQVLQAQIDAEKAANDKLRTDLDATNANLAKFTVDSDGDGVPDFYDKCPNTPAGQKVDGSGCPLAKPVVIITEEDRRVVKDAITNLEFDLGKATIRAKSYPSLDRVAKLLTDKNFSLKLAGHTDNTGSDALNLALSKDRAEAIKAYLVSQGANASRIEATGYGESQPIATNKTAAGRQANRRVEFTLF